MATLTNLQDDLQARMADKSGRFLTDADCTRYLNIAYHEFVLKTESLLREWGFSVTANQFLYGAPSDMIKPGIMMWMQSSRRKLEYHPLSYFADNGGLDLTSSGPANFFTWYEGDDKFRLWPTPSTTSASTTMNDSGGISASDSSVILTSAANFRDQGMILIDNEQMHYYAKSGNTLQQLVRGVGGTTAASHSDGVAVSQSDIHLWYYYQPADLSSGSDTPEIPAPYHDTIVLGALYQALRADGRDQEASIVLQEWMQNMAFAKGEVQKAQASNYISVNLADGYE
jgi:hypothetical protein